MSQSFDPDAAAAPGSGLFGLSTPAEQCQIQILAVPFDATTSYRPGTRRGPRAVYSASHQIDLFDRQFGRPYQAGIAWHTDVRFKKWNREARKLTEPIIEMGGHVDPADTEASAALARIEELGERVNDAVRLFAQRALTQGRIPAILGGDHSVPLGAMQACAAAYPGLGILHIDAHADLRVAFEGFRYSHASILHNVLESAPGVSRLVQIGLRDVGEREIERIQSDDRILAIFDDQWSAARLDGSALRSLIQNAVQQLPDRIYVTFDVDGLDPSLCPGTGTPVPGGLLWGEALALLGALAEAGKQVVGFDLCEVSPGAVADPEGNGWDAIVGARLLYKLCGLSLQNRR
ncbi:MAG: agmatinase family protein [Planctomycetota bacterium]